MRDYHPFTTNARLNSTAAIRQPMAIIMATSLMSLFVFVRISLGVKTEVQMNITQKPFVKFWMGTNGGQ